MVSNVILSALNPKHFNLIVLPTERCNFRCAYCYEDFSVSRMSLAIQKGLKTLVQSRAKEGMSYLSVEYFGGEPLIAEQIVFDLARTFQRLSTQFGFTYRSSMTTNGYKLTLPTFEKLVNFGVTTYQITLDGPLEVHDQTRVLANGRGTFKTIWNNLLAIRDSVIDAHIILRIHCLPTTLKTVRDLLK